MGPAWPENQWVILHLPWSLTNWVVAQRCSHASKHKDWSGQILSHCKKQTKMLADQLNSSSKAFSTLTVIDLNPGIWIGVSGLSKNFEMRYAEAHALHMQRRDLPNKHTLAANLDNGAWQGIGPLIIPLEGRSEFPDLDIWCLDNFCPFSGLWCPYPDLAWVLLFGSMIQPYISSEKCCSTTI